MVSPATLSVAFKSVLLVAALSACTHAPLKPEGARNNRLFPDGIYQHEVKLSLTDESGAKRAFGFSGVVRIKPELLQVVGLGPFGNTLFRVTETQPAHVLKTEIFIGAMKKFESRLAHYVPILRRVLYAPLRGEFPEGINVISQNERSLPTELTVRDGAELAHVKLSQYDRNDFARQIDIQQERFQVIVNVTNYESSDEL